MRIGWTTVEPVDRGGSDGVDHLAILLPGGAFDDAREWLTARTPLLDRDGTTVFEGPPGWDSASVYFDGPGDSVLELIAHRAVPGSFGPSALLGVCEVGIGVEDVDAAVASLGRAGVTPFAADPGVDGPPVAPDRRPPCRLRAAADRGGGAGGGRRGGPCATRPRATRPHLLQGLTAPSCNRKHQVRSRAASQLVRVVARPPGAPPAA